MKGPRYWIDRVVGNMRYIYGKSTAIEDDWGIIKSKFSQLRFDVIQLQTFVDAISPPLTNKENHNYLKETEAIKIVLNMQQNLERLRNIYKDIDESGLFELADDTIEQILKDEKRLKKDLEYYKSRMLQIQSLV